MWRVKAQEIRSGGVANYDARTRPTRCQEQLELVHPSDTVSLVADRLLFAEVLEISADLMSSLACDCDHERLSRSSNHHHPTSTLCVVLQYIS